MNIPTGDEYGTFQWMNVFSKATLKDRFFLLFRQANEHRIFSYYLTVITEFKLTGEVNFRYIMLLGNLGMFGLTWFLYRIYRSKVSTLIILPPLILLLFVPQYNITDWAMVLMCSVNQYLLVFASLAFLYKDGRCYFAFSLLLAAIATFSFGNGMFTFLAGFPILVFRQHKSLKKILIWTGVMIVCIILYFIDYNHSTSLFSKMIVFHQPVKSVAYFLAFFGGVFRDVVGTHTKLMPILGALIFAVFGYLVVLKWEFIRKNPLILSYLLFVIFSALAVTVSRVGYGIITASSDRYRLLPVLFIAILYIALVYLNNGVSQKVFFIIMIASLLLYGKRVMVNFQEMASQKVLLSTGLLSYYIDPENTSLCLPDQKTASTLMKVSIIKGYYKPPTISELYTKDQLRKCMKSIPPSDQIEICIDKLVDRPMILNIDGWAFIKNKKVDEIDINVVLKSPQKIFTFKTITVKREDVLHVFKNVYSGVTENCGFSFTLVKQRLDCPNGTYQVGLCITKKDEILYLKYTDKIVYFIKSDSIKNTATGKIIKL